MGRQTGILSRTEIDAITRVITDRTGLVFPRSREAELGQSLQEAFSKFPEYPNVASFTQHLQSDLLGRRELRTLIATLTVGETYFFRNTPQFNFLREQFVPQLIQKRSRTARTIRFWSAGCSTGEEAYSLAILLRETVPSLAKWNIYILGTDISEEALKQAEEGEYREWSFREIDPDIKNRYFTRTAGGWKINPEVRSMVTFRYLNLIEDLYPLTATGTSFMDLIMCRNVMIYFQPSCNLTITRRFYRALTNEGCLIVGHSEHTDYIFQGFTKEFLPHAVIYTKREQGSELDRGLRLRFRGSGVLPPNVVPTFPRALREASAKAPMTAEEQARHRRKRETVLFEEGATAYAEGRQKVAQARFREVLELNPRNHRACYLVALMEANQNHLRKAAEYALRAVENYPLSLEAYYLLAVIAREEGDRPREIDYLKKVLYINRDFILGHYQMGLFYLQEGNPVLARKFLRNTLKLLEKWDEIDYIEGTEGMTVGRLRETVLRELRELQEEDQISTGEV